MTTQVFKRASTAYAAAGDRPVLVIRTKSETLYIVGDLERLDSVELLTAPQGERGGRYVAGQVSLGHLDRLGNANGAAGDVNESAETRHAVAFGERTRSMKGPSAGSIEKMLGARQAVDAPYVQPPYVQPSAADGCREEGFPEGAA